MDWLNFLAVQGTLKSSPPQFKSISSLVLSFLYRPTLTSILDYWKNHPWNVFLPIGPLKCMASEVEDLE